MNGVVIVEHSRKELCISVVFPVVITSISVGL
jgi:hypothetical protein